MMQKVKQVFIYGFMSIGIVAFLLFTFGLISDIKSFDPTSGGYEPPYEDYTGEPINFDELDKSQEGLIGRGYVIDFHLNCTTGMISFEMFKQKIDFRPVSERAIKVHQPDKACLERGFNPKFS